jgi:hypothetical protein
MEEKLNFKDYSYTSKLEILIAFTGQTEYVVTRNLMFHCFEVWRYDNGKFINRNLLKTWEDVLLHFSFIENNLPDFTKKVENYIAEVVANKI